MHSLVSLGLLAGLVLAASATSDQYNSISGFANSRGCVPSGYFQAQDLGNTNPNDMVTRCEARCTSLSKCEAWVGQLNKAKDSGRYSGSCFYYASSPAAPRRCADHPTNLIAEKKDPLRCFSCSARVATAFCSSYLSIGTVTKYIATVTPRTTITTTTSTTASTTLGTTSLITTTTTGTVLTTTDTTDISLTTINSLDTEFITTTVVTTNSMGTVATQATVVKRTVVPPPACLQTGLPASRISSACSRLSIRSTTVSRVKTVPTSTQTATSTKAITSTRTTTDTLISTSTTLTTSVSVSIIMTTFTSVAASTTTSVSTVVSTTTVASPVFTFVQRYTAGCYPITLQGQFYNIPAANFGAALQYCANKCTSLDNSGFYPATQQCRQIYVSYTNTDRTGGYDCQWGGTVNGPGDGEWTSSDFQCGLPSPPYRKYGEWYQVVGLA